MSHYATCQFLDEKAFFTPRNVSFFLNYCKGVLLLLLAICWGNSGWGGRGLMLSLICDVDDFFKPKLKEFPPQKHQDSYLPPKITFPIETKGNLRVHQTLTSFVSFAVMVSCWCKSSFFVDKSVCAAVLPSIFLCSSSFLIYLFSLSGCGVSSFQSVDVAFYVYPVP